MATPANRINISELDFDQIKTNLKIFLKSQDEFKDYDFEGSGLNILLDILAYNTHYNAYYLNMVANEAFLDTALLRNSVVSHAKTLGYVPYSVRAAVATINLTVYNNIDEEPTLTIPRGTVFRSESVDNKTYSFVVLDQVSVDMVDGAYYFENLPIYQGELISYSYTHDTTTNPSAIFTLPDTNIDTNTIKVSVRQSVNSTDTEVFTFAKDVLDVTDTSPVYFLQEGRNGLYQIYFGDGVLGKAVEDGQVVTISYLVTSAQEGNKISRFTLERPISNYTIYDLEVIESSTGGAGREPVDKIKYSAPLQYASQNRLVTFKDYEVYIKKNYTNIDSISIWGGETETPPIYGKVYISIKPKDGFYLSENEKSRIINEVVDPKSVVTVRAEIRDAEYLYLLVDTKVQYDQKRTTSTSGTLASLVKNAIVNYKNTYLDTFGGKFVLSKLQEAIDSVDISSIIGSECNIRAQKRFVPTLNLATNYTINFAVPLSQGTSTNKLSSSEFQVYDSTNILRDVILEEIPKSFTGINSIQVIDGGTGYTSTPTVTITGDGFGAVATAVVRNGKIERIDIENSGIDYNKAVVTITGGGGFGAQAIAVVDSKIGKLRVVYYTSNAERQVVIPNVGTIDYNSGIIQLNDLTIVSSKRADGQIYITSGVQSSIIQSVKNVILTVDELDPASITVTMENVI